MRRFLTTVATVEPQVCLSLLVTAIVHALTWQVFGQLLQVGDVSAVTEVGHSTPDFHREKWG